MSKRPLPTPPEGIRTPKIRRTCDVTIAEATTSEIAAAIPVELLKYKYYESNRTLRADDYRSLEDKTYLTEGAIDFYLSHLVSVLYQNQTITKNVFIFECYFNLTLKKKRDTSRIMKRLKVNVFTKEYLVFPLNYDCIYKNVRVKHWYLAIVQNPVFAICDEKMEEKRTPEILFLNSIVRIEEYNLYADLLRQFLAAEAKRFYDVDIVLDEKTMPAKILNVPQQRNNYDCGCYLLMFVEMLLENNGFPNAILPSKYAQRADEMRETISKTTMELMKEQYPEYENIEDKLPKIKLPPKNVKL